MLEGTGRAAGLGEPLGGRDFWRGLARYLGRRRSSPSGEYAKSYLQVRVRQQDHLWSVAGRGAVGAQRVASRGCSFGAGSDR